MDTVSAFEAKDMLQDMIKHAVQNRHQFQITSDEGSVVMLPQETYDNILVTLELLSTPGLLDKMKVQDVENEFFELEEFQHASNH